ncbi:LOW QUALITY PROTEIN: nerylneryl diphosphate synthase CPT2, chloroplastic-like [Capsicum annuum]|uniref:LOW QUALITY PROTEIN: nerylneryl diphosphate synthase CPT2, chloroplastic-like n=1 Tax=Capsicum annuum TaxID=4072 RepID=UPI001FB0F64D|nr:LOW QUALITY PROTEIN: nerylneryl diphosphate synthase CPT2, chloroplastic-like [Capsicum annuum]
MAEYEACILGLRLAVDMGVQELLVLGGSDLLVHQIQGEWETRDLKLMPYRQYLQDLCQRFVSVKFRHILRIHNEIADALATLASMLQHPDKAYIDLVHIQSCDQHAYCNAVEKELDGEPWFFDIKRYIQLREYPAHATSDQKRTIWRLISLGLQCRKSSSVSIGEFKGTRNFQILNPSLTGSARELSKISSSLSLQTQNLHYDDDDNDELQLHRELMPKNIAIIMDGNRRWAKAKGLPVHEGHKLITPKLKEICDVSSKLGIQVITAFAFSTENWKRSTVRVFLLQLFVIIFSLSFINRYGVRVSVIGCKSNLPISLQKCIASTEEITKDNKGLHLVIALNYGGYYDIIQATKSIASKVMNGFLHLEDINENLFDQELESKCLSIPNPDLLIRTGGEQRFSNFLLWQLAYSEFYFTKILFPDFGEKELKEAIHNFQQRHRRFGGHTY